jgi:hypothetical protein
MGGIFPELPESLKGLDYYLFPLYLENAIFLEALEEPDGRLLRNTEKLGYLESGKRKVQLGPAFACDAVLAGKGVEQVRELLSGV